MIRRLATSLGVLSIAAGMLLAGCARDGATTPQVPKDIQAIFDKDAYKAGTWGLRVVDLDTGEVLQDLRPERQFLIGSVRKIFPVGQLLEQVGPTHTIATPVHRQGSVSGGVLNGDLILVANGDLTMGGRANGDGTIAVADLDHNDANALGNATLTAPDPLAGYKSLARQVAASGITRVSGEVVIDDRLFVPFPYRGGFSVHPIFVNDDAVDVIITPTAPGQPAAVDWRPKSAAFAVTSSLVTSAAGTKASITLDPEPPGCIGSPGCTANVSGQIPVDFVPPLTGAFPVVQTFTTAEPANYARTVFIEALRNAGVTIDADAVAPNPAAKLPAKNSYAAETRVAQLVSEPYSEDARLVLKPSYNIGADTSLVLYGLARGVDNMPAALDLETRALTTEFGIAASDFSFFDGGGGGLTAATLGAITTFLRGMSTRSSFPAFKTALPILGVDGSLALHDFERDPSLAGAKGKVFAKTGTFIEGTQDGKLNLRAKALAGYITAKSGRRLTFALALNDAGSFDDFAPLLQAVEDEGTISAILWREY